MGALIHQLVPIIVIVAVALVIWVVVERFSPDQAITKIVQIVLFAVVLIMLLAKLFPMLGMG